jgi:hypothetical protein
MIYLGIFVASLLGSPHCVGMCGGFATWGGGTSENRTKINDYVRIVFYNLGRLLTYLTLGAMCGAFGSTVDELGLSLGLQRVSFIIISLLICLYGIALLIKTLSVGSILDYRIFSTLKITLPEGIAKQLKRSYSLLGIPLKLVVNANKKKFMMKEKSHGIYFPFMLGTTSTLLPCGWLYTYLTVAASTGSWLESSIIMFFFWLGTLPLITGIGLLSNKILTSLLPWKSVITGFILLICGSMSLIFHWQNFNHINEKNINYNCHEQ